MEQNGGTFSARKCNFVGCEVNGSSSMHNYHILQVKNAKVHDLLVSEQVILSLVFENCLALHVMHGVDVSAGYS